MFVPEGQLLAVLGAWSSIVVDFICRAAGIANLLPGFMSNLPYIGRSSLREEVESIVLRLVGLSEAVRPETAHLAAVEGETNALCRRMLQARLDAAVAIAFGVSIDDLVGIYRAQFSVMRGYDRGTVFDGNGRVVTTTLGTNGQSTWTHPQSGAEYTFEPPFTTFDREAAMREAYAELSQLLEQEED